MKEMANIQAGMSFYGAMPDMFNLVLNSDHKLVKEVLADEDKECAAAVEMCIRDRAYPTTVLRTEFAQRCAFDVSHVRDGDNPVSYTHLWHKTYSQAACRRQNGWWRSW